MWCRSACCCRRRYLANNQLTSLPCEALMAGCKRLSKIQINGNEGLDPSKLPPEIQEMLLL